MNPKRAQERQHYVLRRMHELGWLVTEASTRRRWRSRCALNPDQRDTFAFRADYVAEMARAAIFEQYGEPAYVSGLQVYTTLSGARTRRRPTQPCAAGVLDYDRRHGYRGPEG